MKDDFAKKDRVVRHRRPDHRRSNSNHRANQKIRF